MHSFNLQDYLSILKRRKNVFVVIATLVFLVSLVFTFQYSNYRSTVTVEVALPEVASNVTTQGRDSPAASMEAIADFQISRIRQKVLATGSLVEIITKFNLYPEKRAFTPIAELAEKMREKVRLELVSTSLANPASAQKATANQLSAIAFRLSFDYDNPSMAQQVTNEIVSRFLDEDIRQRRAQAQETSNFLASQIKSLEESLVEQEKNIAEFRSQHGDVRPEALAFNQQVAVSTAMSLQNIESQITVNEGTQGALRGQLALLDPYSRVTSDGQVLLTPSLQLKALKSEYATLSGKYGPEHPDVVNVIKQIQSLEKQRGMTDETGSLQAKIIDLRTKLTAQQDTSGPENPDIVSMQKQLKSLEAQLDKALRRPVPPSRVKEDADNPAYLQVVAQIKAAEEQRGALIGQRDELRAQVEKYQQAVAINPEVEQKMAALTRDYDNSRFRYRELKDRKMVADMSATIEQDRSGQRLVVIDPPDLPLKTKPPRILFILAGIMMAVLGGLGAAFSLQILSPRVVGPRHLEALVGVAPLIVVPHLATESEIKSWDRTKIHAIGLAFFAFVVMLAAVNFFVMPLDVLWSVVVRRLGLY